MPEALVGTNFTHRYHLRSHGNRASSERRDSSQYFQPNRLRVDDQPNTLDRYFDELRGQVIQAITSLGYPTLVAVQCEVAADRIVLSGALPSYHLKQMAQVAALRVAGPGKVDNRVVVTSL